MKRYIKGSLEVAREGFQWLIIPMRIDGESPEELLSHDEYEDYEKAPIIAQLPHQCDEWVIGGESEILDLIEDLTSALERIRQC